MSMMNANAAATTAMTANEPLDFAARNGRCRFQQ